MQRRKYYKPVDESKDDCFGHAVPVEAAENTKQKP